MIRKQFVITFVHESTGMKKKSFEAGEEVVLISDDSIKYVIQSVYGNGNAICKYLDVKTNSYMELSIPLVALIKTNANITQMHNAKSH